MSKRALFAALLVLAASSLATANEDVPILTVSESSFGATWVFDGPATPPVTLPVPHGQPLTFSWLGDASGYAGIILGYRAGWDITDPADELDPGWLQPGFDSALLSAPPRSFPAGMHTFHVLVSDMGGRRTLATFLLDIQPEVSGDDRSWGEVKILYRD